MKALLQFKSVQKIEKIFFLKGLTTSDLFDILTSSRGKQNKKGGSEMEDIINKVKSYVQFELDLISQGFNAKLALERAYGAVMFVTYCGYGSELGEWWDSMLPKFEEGGRHS